MFRASVSAGESGPVVTLSGETDFTNVGELSDLLTEQLAGGTLHLTIDASGWSFADSVCVRVLLSAAITLRQQAGGLILLRPQPALARVLQLMGADEVVAIRGETTATPNPGPG